MKVTYSEQFILRTYLMFFRNISKSGKIIPIKKNGEVSRQFGLQKILIKEKSKKK